MTTVLPLLLGVVSGLVGFAPLLIAARLSRHHRTAVRDYAIPIGLGSVFVSLVVLVIALFVAAQIAAESFPFYGVALVVAFLVASGVFVGLEVRRGGQ